MAMSDITDTMRRTYAEQPVAGRELYVGELAQQAAVRQVRRDAAGQGQQAQPLLVQVHHQQRVQRKLQRSTQVQDVIFSRVGWKAGVRLALRKGTNARHCKLSGMAQYELGTATDAAREAAQA